MMMLGKRIEKIAEAKGLSAKDLADAMGVARTHIYRILKAEHLGSEVLTKAAEALGVSITDFFEDDSSHHRVITGSVGQTGGVSATGYRVEQKNLGDTALRGQGAAEAARILEQLTKCEQERESWQRERQALNKVISTQELLISALQTSGGR